MGFYGISAFAELESVHAALTVLLLRLASEANLRYLDDNWTSRVAQ